ncbi:hypothetical protein JE024_20130 [Streptomyces zhihengii]|uniref:Sensor histidine kinase n=2 Tax=Streptomyces zhihengii TaxID=1818004 RepID=A0ABS2UU11_9ACTN|nr:hypothetical protein [Streptomyces zhihengii]MBM9621005.1 hypothetical protein [Streptomyces zhihengii]
MRLRLVAPRGSDTRYVLTYVGAVVALAVSITCAAAAVWPPAICAYSAALTLALAVSRQHEARTAAAAAEHAA